MECFQVRVYRYPSGRSVSYRYPEPCRPGATTFTRVEERVEPEYERRRGYCLVHRPWRLVLPGRACEVLDRILSGETPRLVLLGPPGTGKSKFLELVEVAAPANTVRYKVEESIVKWVGETEKRFRKILDQVEEQQPSFLLVDEGDRLIQPRDTGDSSGGYAVISANLVNMFLSRLQEWSNRRARVGVIITSNRTVKQLDTALVRSERLEPIYFPSPDAEAVKLLAELYGKKISDAEAARLAATSPSFANIVEYLKTGRLRPFQPSPSIYLEYADCTRVKPRARLDRRARLIVPEDPPLGVKIAAVLSCLWRSRPLVVVTSPSAVEDARYTAEAMESPLALAYPPPAAGAAYATPYLAALDVPVFLIGSWWQDNLLRIDWDQAATMVGGEERLAEAAAGERMREASDPKAWLLRKLSGVEWSS